MSRRTIPASRADRLRALIDTAPALYCVAPLDAPLAFEYVGPNCRELLGYPARDVVEDTEFWQTRLHPADRRRVERAFGLGGRSAVAPLPTVNYRLRGADGRYRDIAHHSRVSRLGAGNERALVSVCIVGGDRAHAGPGRAMRSDGGDALQKISSVAERLALCTDFGDLQLAFDDTFAELFGGDGAAVLVYEPKDRSLQVVAACGDAPGAGTVYPGSACLAVLSHATHRNAATTCRLRSLGS
jgi:hypothetical protein